MGDDSMTALGVCAILFIGLPWLMLHYTTQWKRARGISSEDEKLLDDLHDMARRLDDRLQTIERIMTAENPRWREIAAPQPTSLDRRH